MIKGPFTSTEFMHRLETAGIRLSMDGRGRALDNVFVERLWRTVKSAEVHLKADATPREAARGLEPHCGFYHSQRLHQALDDQTPAAVYFGSYL